MDGNGRWAQSRGRPRFYGHLRGARTARKIIEAAANKNIAYLTLFAFSTENWQRPTEEVNFLMDLLARQIRKEQATLIKNNIRFRCIGDLSRLPASAQKAVTQAVQATQNCAGMNLTFALNYGGRQELQRTMVHLAQLVKNGALDPTEIDEDMISHHLNSSFLPDPDLILRTSGEYRLSNFFLWQAAYSEIYVTPKPWPDFNCADFAQALDVFSRRERRFGCTQEQASRSLVVMPSPEAANYS